MLNEQNILFAEIFLARFYAENKDLEWYPAGYVQAWIKQAAQGVTVRRAEIRGARKRLGLESNNFDGEYRWSWRAGAVPEDVWAEKSAGVIRGEEPGDA